MAGNGRMGAAIAGRLLRIGREVAVWNRTAEKTRPLAAAGAKVMATPGQLAAASDTILTDAAGDLGETRRRLRRRPNLFKTEIL